MGRVSLHPLQREVWGPVRWPWIRWMNMMETSLPCDGRPSSDHCHGHPCPPHLTLAGNPQPPCAFSCLRDSSGPKVLMSTVGRKCQKKKKNAGSSTQPMSDGGCSPVAPTSQGIQLCPTHMLPHTTPLAGFLRFPG